MEFPFVAVNPQAGTRLVWPVSQTCQGGERVEWTGPPDSKTPASATGIGAVEGGGGRTETYLGAAALVISPTALGLALRRRTN